MFITEKTGVFIIGEVAQAHDGSLGAAHAYIDAIADAGADAVKFQTHIASDESTKAEPWRVNFSYEDELRYDYWKRMEFTKEQWGGLKDHAEKRGLVFMSSPFSIKAAEMLENLGMKIWKISSGEVSDPWLVDYVLKTSKPIIFSTGMSRVADVKAFARKLAQKGADYGVLQCTTNYPVSPEKVGLNVLADYLEIFGNDVAVGLSDHSGEIWPSLAAVTYGARIIETHVCLSKYDFGPDVSSSLTQEQFAYLVKGIRYTRRMVVNPVDKDKVSEELQSTSKIFAKSVCARVDIPAKTVLTREMLALKKPANGIPAAQADSLIGKTANRAFEVDEFINNGDIE